MTSQEPTKRKKDQAVYQIIRTSRCFNCDTKQDAGTIVKLNRSEDEREVLCAKCAGIDQLQFLPGRNARLTQLAKKHSKQSYVVLKWSELWKCYERQGLILEPEAIESAQRELNAENSK